MKTRVLVVDDDAILRDSFVDALRAAPDMEPLAPAGSVAEGARQLDAGRPDVLLVDLGLPDGSGLKLIMQARQRLTNCDAMVVSVFGDEANVMASIEAGATGYLLKDASATELVAQVRVLRAGGSPINAVIARRLLMRFGPPLRLDRAQQGAVRSTSHATLSPRERDMLNYCAKGYSFDEIAVLMSVSPQTVTSFVKRTYKKLQVHSKTAAVYEARALGLLCE